MWFTNEISYDGISCMNFGLFLCNLNQTGRQSHSVIGDIKLHTDKTNLMEFNYLTGIEYSGMLDIEMVLGSYDYIDRIALSRIQNWLIGRNDYKELHFEQEDMTELIYNCIFTSCELVTFANLPYAIKVKGVADRPYAIEKEKTYKYSITPNATNRIKLMNTSHVHDYTYPKLEFTSNASGGYVSIINKNNNNYETRIENLLSNERIAMDSQTQVLTTSNVGMFRIGDFNKHWLELVSGMNELIVTGTTNEIIIKYANVRKCL